jgi:eukaryotic-like serine/threonine-protein kinase
MRAAISLGADLSAQSGNASLRPMVASSRPPRTEEPGDSIGRYKLLHQIGAGGMGVVYLAEQEQPVRRRVALKIIKLGMDTQSVIARFEAERQALALMDHPKISRVLDAGATRTGRPYFVMELVRGIRITDYCEQNQCSLSQRLDLFVQICQAIQHAHQKGIIHRDIKPSNILVTLHDGVPMPKVIDFGVAKATEQTLSAQTAFTVAGQFLGTPAYMSPEQTEFNGVDIDTRSDVYSLGVLLYELLTGQTPFETSELLDTGLETMCRTIREKEPLKPSTRLTRELANSSDRTRAKSENPGQRLALGSVATTRLRHVKELIPRVRGDLDWIVMKALEKDRARRYETANDLAQDVQRHLGNETVTARPPSASYRFQKLIRRNRIAVAAASAVAVAVVVGLVSSTWLFFNARTEARKNQTMAHFLKGMLRSLDPALAKGRQGTILHGILDQTAQQIAADLNSQPDIQAELRGMIGNTYYELADYAKAEAMHREALRARRALFGELDSSVAASLTDLGNAVNMQDRQPEAEVLLRQALAMRRTIFGPEHVEVAHSLTWLADNLTDQGKLAEAEKLQREALQMQRKLLRPDHPNVVLSLNNIGRVLQLDGRLGEAEVVYREVLALPRDQETLSSIDSVQKLALVLRDEGKLIEAETVSRQALAMSRKLLGNDHALVVTTFNELALVLQLQGRRAAVEALLREHLGRLRESLPADDPAIVGTLIELSQNLIAQEKFLDAEQPAREALEILEEHPPDDWRAGNCRSFLGAALLGQKKFEEAGPLLLAGYEGMKRHTDELPTVGPQYLNDSIQRLVQFYDVTGQPDQAAVWQHRLQGLAPPTFPTQSPATAPQE